MTTAGVTVAVILVANGWLVWFADKSWGFWVWVFVFVPLANAALAVVLLACSPIVRRVAGMSAALHVWVTLVGCAIAVFVDAAIIIGWLSF